MINAVKIPDTLTTIKKDSIPEDARIIALPITEELVPMPPSELDLNIKICGLGGDTECLRDIVEIGVPGKDDLAGFAEHFLVGDGLTTDWESQQPQHRDVLTPELSSDVRSLKIGFSNGKRLRICRSTMQEKSPTIALWIPQLAQPTLYQQHTKL